MISELQDVSYEPTDDEEFMGPRQQAWFRNRLRAWRDEILDNANKTLGQLTATSLKDPDAADRAASEADWTTELRTRDRQRKLLAKIAVAMQRIDEGEYGWCEITGEQIPLKRLIARPIATMTLEAQEAHERNERISSAA